MLKSIKKWVQRLFATSTSAKEKKQNRDQSSNESEPITDREQIDGTPFWIQKVNEGKFGNGWFVTMKGYKLTPTFKTRKEAIEYIWLENNGWNVIANICIIIHEQVANEAAKEWEKREATRGMTKETIESLGLTNKQIEESRQDYEQAMKQRKNRNLGDIN